MTHLVGGRTLVQRAVLALLALLAAVLALQVTTATAAPQTQTYSGQAGGSTPDIFRSDIADYFRPDGSPADVERAGTLNIRLDGEPVVAYCVDVDAPLALTPTTSDVSGAAPSSAASRAKLYILLNATPTGAPTPEKRQQAAVAQVAIWVLEGDLREAAPTSDAALNDDVEALLAAARAWAATEGTLGLTVAPPAPGATTTTVTVTGRPGSVVALTITAGQGTLSAGQVTIGAGGSATATLTSPTPGSVTVGASTTGDGQLFRVVPLNETQATEFARPTVLTATAPVSFQAAPGSGPGPGPGGVVTTPNVPVTGRPAGPIALRISKTAPTTRRVLQLVRYRITVRNPTRRAATGVVLRDRIPRGLTFVRASRKVAVRKGAVVISLGRMAPGARRTVTIWMRATAGVRGARTNVATVTGENVRRVSARAGTTFRPLAGRVQPAVTG